MKYIVLFIGIFGFIDSLFSFIAFILDYLDND